MLKSRKQRITTGRNEKTILAACPKAVTREDLRLFLWSFYFLFLGSNFHIRLLWPGKTSRDILGKSQFPIVFTNVKESRLFFVKTNLCGGVSTERKKNKQSSRHTTRHHANY